MKNLSNQVFNNLTAIERTDPYIRPNGAKVARWLCKCKCGELVKVRTQALTSGSTKSCGCLQVEIVSQVKHGSARRGKVTSLYSKWLQMKARCLNPNNKRYSRYGARGIAIYSDWIEDFEAFDNYIKDNLGECPKGYSLDRINNNGNYEPGNLRWADAYTQTHNREMSLCHQSKNKE